MTTIAEQGGTKWVHQKAEMYQESHEILREINEVIIQASHNTRSCYRVSTCAVITLERHKMVRGKELEFAEEKMKTMKPNKNEIYNLLEIKQADGIKTKKVFE